MLVTFRNQRMVSFAPAAVRFLAGEVVQTGTLTTNVAAPCVSEHEALDLRSQAPRREGRETSPSSAARATRSRSAARGSPGSRRAVRPNRRKCVRSSRASRRLEGEISEEALADPRIRSQTATGSAEVETDLEDEETGRVVERVSWKLTFTRKR